MRCFCSTCEAEAEREAEEADQLARWKWVLSEVGSFLPFIPSPQRHDDPRTACDVIEHLSWLTREGPSSPELTNPRKAMRWACFAEGVAVALRLMPLAECKRLNMTEAWEAEKASRAREELAEEMARGVVAECDESPDTERDPRVHDTGEAR